ncbi:MAG: iron ABC transporter permease [bacterium]|nr:iron ABC transporter permease [bacterium]
MLGGLGIALVAMFLLSVALGSVNIPLNEIVRVLLGGEASRDSWTNVILVVRLPKALTAALAGAALGVSGLMMQTLFRNPLADPFVLGINSGASLGAALVVLGTGTVGGTLLAGFGLGGDFLLAFSAAAGAGAVMMIVLLVARRVQSSVTLLVMGLMFGYLTSALVSLLLYFNLPERVQAFTNWSFGSFGGVTWGQMQVMLPVIGIGLLLALVLVKPLNALLLGEVYARSMGLNVRRARIGIVLTTALLAGTVTAFCGPVAFLGLAVPHLTRGLFNTSDHRLLVPGTILMGALVALIASLIAGMPGSRMVLPLNAVTALLGAPVVMWVILRQQQRQNVFGGGA